MHYSRLLFATLLYTGCTLGPRASMFMPVAGQSAAPVELMTPEADPFLETPAIPTSPGRIQAPELPKLGPISSAARQQLWRAANSIGPAPRSLPSSIPLTDTKKTPASEAIGLSTNGKHVEAKQTSKLSGDGQHGFVQLMPPPPDDVAGSAAAPRESRYFELPPAPEN